MINYTKNHITGERIEVFKVKEPSPIKGEAYIYVCDDNGNVIEEIYTENTLTNKGIEHMLYNALKNKESFDENCFNLTNFGTLYLVKDETLTEDKFLGDVKGEIVGWANAFQSLNTYNVKQGSIDLVTTNIDLEDKSFNMFFKFGYDKGNGIFNALMWGTNHINPASDLNSLEGLAYAPREVEKVELVGVNTWLTVADNRGYLYCIKDRKVYKLNWIMGGNRKRLTCETTGKELQLLDSNYVHYALFNTIDNRFWVFASDYIYKYDLDWNYIEKINRLPEDYFTSATWDLSKGNQFCFFGEQIYGVWNKNILIWDYNGNKISTQTDLIAGAEDITTIFTDNKYVYLYAKLYGKEERVIIVCKVNADTKKLEIVCQNARAGKTYDNRNWTYTYKRPLDNSFLIVNKEGTTGYIAKAITNTGAITVLPSYITKGTANNMLIHYKFKFSY